MQRLQRARIAADDHQEARRALEALLAVGADLAGRRRASRSSSTVRRAAGRGEDAGRRAPRRRPPSGGGTPRHGGRRRRAGPVGSAPAPAEPPRARRGRPQRTARPLRTRALGRPPRARGRAPRGRGGSRPARRSGAATRTPRSAQPARSNSTGIFSVDDRAPRHHDAVDHAGADVLVQPLDVIRGPVADRLAGLLQRGCRRRCAGRARSARRAAARARAAAAAST